MKLLFCDFFSQHDKESVLIEQALQTFLGILKTSLQNSMAALTPPQKHGWGRSWHKACEVEDPGERWAHFPLPCQLV